MLALTLALWALFLQSLVLASDSCNSRLTSDYALTHTLTLSSPLTTTTYSFDLKFSKVDIPCLAATATIASTTYQVFYFPRAQEICIQKGTTHTVVISLLPGVYDSFSFLSTAVSLNSNLVQFTSATTTCVNSANLKPTTFSEPVG